MLNEHILQLVDEINDTLAAHQDSNSDESVFDALGALAYFAGTILIQAPDRETRVEAHRFFLQMLQEGLTQNQGTRH